MLLSTFFAYTVTKKQKIFFHESKLQCFQDCITVQDNLLARVLFSKFDSEKQLVDFILAIQATLSSFSSFFSLSYCTAQIFRGL